jgi:hypothetical protein
MLQFPVDGNSREQCVVFVVRQQPSYSLPRQQPFIVHFEYGSSWLSYGFLWFPFDALLWSRWGYFFLEQANETV